MIHNGSRPAQEHPGSWHILFIRMLPGHTPRPGLGYGELEAPALSQALGLSPFSRADPLSQGPFMVGAEHVPAWWEPAASRAAPGAPLQLRAVLLAVPHKGKAWLMAPYG